MSLLTGLAEAECVVGWLAGVRWGAEGILDRDVA